MSVRGEPVSIISAVRRPFIIVVTNKWFPNRRCKAEPPKPSLSKNVFSAAGWADPAPRLTSAEKQTIAVTTSPRGDFFIAFFLIQLGTPMQFGCLKQLIWIDIHTGENIFGQRQFIELLVKVGDHRERVHFLLGKIQSHKVILGHDWLK